MSGPSMGTSGWALARRHLHQQRFVALLVDRENRPVRVVTDNADAAGGASQTRASAASPQRQSPLSDLSTATAIDPWLLYPLNQHGQDAQGTGRDDEAPHVHVELEQHKGDAPIPAGAAHQADWSSRRHLAAGMARDVVQRMLDGLGSHSAVQRPAPWYMLEPNGWLRILWDIFTSALIVMLMIYIPLLICFYEGNIACDYFNVTINSYTPPPGQYVAPDATVSGSALLVLTNYVFLIDIVLNFLTGVFRISPDKGLVYISYDLGVVARQYATSWLVVDIIACIPLDCIIVPYTEGIDTYNAGYAIKLIRVLGLGRRVNGNSRAVVNWVASAGGLLRYQPRTAVKAAACLLLMLHYFSCFLWLILRIQDFPPMTWAAILKVDELSVYAQWTWSIFSVTSAMIGLGYGYSPPATLAEAAYWIAVMLFVATGFAIFNGFLFASVLYFMSAKARHKQSQELAESLIERRRLPQGLARLVREHVREQQHTGQGPVEDDLVLRMLPGSLQRSLAVYMAAPALQVVPIFRDSPQLMRRAAYLMQRQSAVAGELIQAAGTASSRIIFLTKGYADVTVRGRGVVDMASAGAVLGGEALLPVPPRSRLPRKVENAWQGRARGHWPALATVVTLTPCSFLVLDVERLKPMLAEFPEVQEQLEELSERYLELISRLRALGSIWQAPSKHGSGGAHWWEETNQAAEEAAKEGWAKRTKRRLTLCSLSCCRRRSKRDKRKQAQDVADGTQGSSAVPV